MTLSVWRYSHLILALVSGAFLLVASLTGIILTFEPMVHASKSYDMADLQQLSLAQTIENLENKYVDVLELTIDSDDFVLASVVLNESESATFYVDPTTGKKIGEPYEKAEIFKFATNLHRSLFLKSLGRFFVGIASLLLFLIAVTGSLLILKRQGNLQGFFSKINRESFEQYYHIISGRLLLLPILIIALTGVYLSVEKFNLLPSASIDHTFLFENEIPSAHLLVSDFALFKATPLSEVKSILFPFSDDEADYFQLALSDREILVNQFNGKVISEVHYPFVVIATNLSLVLHTGQGSVLWSVVLLLASCAILFFIYSGFKMTLRRKKKSKVILSSSDKDNCEYILLVGSETGGTYEFAKLFQAALIAQGKRVFIGNLNDYTTFKKALHLIVFTATYGEGEAPSNAGKFSSLIKSDSLSRINQISFSVVGFGSLRYPDYCQFAIEVDALLEKQPSFKRNMILCKINNQSHVAFKDWVQQWSALTNIPLRLPQKKKELKSQFAKPFEVVHKTAINTDDTFLIRLRPKDKIQFRSGDLLALQPEEGSPIRLYSIAKIESDILLSVKKHVFGICSNHLNNLSQNDILEGTIRSNPNFHFPSKAESVVLICNGTGIAPFLGMLHENKKQIPVYLFWGGRTKKSYQVYQDHIAYAIKKEQLTQIKLAYSQENKEKTYVQDIVSDEAGFIATKLHEGTTIMICGSIRMQKELLDILNEIVQTHLKVPLSDFEHKKQLKMDCY